MSNAGGLVARLAESGIDPQLLADVAQALFTAEAKAEILDARRKSERERKAKSREVTGQDVTECDTPSPLSPPKKDPTPQKITPPISPNPDDSSADADRPLTAGEIVEAWNERMVPQGFPAVRRLTGHRQRQLAARLRENTIDDWRDAMTALEKSRFCKGDNDRGWRADFDFLLQPKSFTKLLEGAYP
jgi:hypothetical protein